MFVSFAPSNRLTVERLEGRDLMSATFAGPTDLFSFGYQPEPAATHVLYQDITIPVNSTATGGFVRVSDPAGESKEQVVTINELNGVPTPQGKAVLTVRKSGGGSEDTY